jgi:protein ImuB
MTAFSSPRRILSLWLRRLPADRIARLSPDLADRPLALVARVKSAHRLAALNDAAARLGLRPLMPLADARAMYPALIVADADEAADARLLDAIADWCDRYTPLVGLDPPDGLLLDISGCAHLFGGEAALCRDLEQRLAGQGFHVRMAVAQTAGCAWAVARFGKPTLVAEGRQREELAPLPLAALRIGPETTELLAQAGLKTIGQLLGLPRAPLAARFGADLIRRIDQALGHDDEPIVPRLPVPSFLAERRFAEPIGREADVLGALAHLARELCRALERHGKGARRLQAALFRADGKVARIDVGTAAPLRDDARMQRLFLDRLAVLGDEADPGFGFDALRLSALTVERLDAVQAGLRDDDPARETAHLIDRLTARFGVRRVQRLLPQDKHVPEEASLAVPAQTRPPASVDCAQDGFMQDSLIPARPIRLFEPPQPIEATAEVPDGPPVQFRWRRVWHQVAHAEGPERIALPWWRNGADETPARDYFRVESRDGARVWLYREGVYAAGEKPPRWFLHGIFA